jgi:PAS domain S-box-containing protein
MIGHLDILNSNILIVDDQPANVILLEHLLCETGYQHVTTTMDPYSVCELHRNNHYDLIILDLEMPGMNGFQVMDCLKEMVVDDYVPILVITALPEHKLRSLASGAKDFIAKPLDLIEVKTRIHNMLEVRLLYKSLEQYNIKLEMLATARTDELHESETRFRRLTELSCDWYWEQDENGQLTKTFGPALEMLGMNIDDMVDETREDQGAYRNITKHSMFETNLAARRPFRDFVYSRTNKDGTQQLLMVSGEPMFDTRGRFCGYQGVGKDVTKSMHAKPAVLV